MKSDKRPWYVCCELQGITDGRLIRIIISKLQLGDDISKISELAKSCKIEKRELPKGINRFITSIRIKFERDPENKKVKTFDRIRINCGLVSSLEFFEEIEDYNIKQQTTIKAKQGIYIHKNREEILEKVLDKLKTSKSFSKYGITINFLRIGKVNLKNDSSLEIIFELKQWGQDGQNNSNISKKNGPVQSGPEL